MSKSLKNNSSGYYYVTDPNLRRQAHLVKSNENYYVEVDENVDFRQYISLELDKFLEKKITRPKSTKYSKVRPVLQGIFLDHYLLALKNISRVSIDTGEFYIIKQSNQWYEAFYYSPDEKNKQTIHIDFRDSITDLWLMITSSRGYYRRQFARKDGTPVSIEEFKPILNLTLKFLYDHESYLIYLDSYWKSFYNLVGGTETVEVQDFQITEESAINNILLQLENRKATIEKRLIEEDNDTNLDRVKLRGELEGLVFSINSIKIHR